jgi:hypothetical protein
LILSGKIRPPGSAQQSELQNIDGKGGWGKYKNDDVCHADFLGFGTKNLCTEQTDYIG